MSDNKNIVFSATARKEIIQKMISEPADLVVIGGGITGAGIALDAASRGLKVMLLEKNDFASGTSSRSTKLIHGGLRYLKQMEFALVRDVAKERQIVFRNARHLVIPGRMLLPVIRNGSLGRFSAFLGLTLYDLLAGVKKSEKKQMFGKSGMLNLEPLLNAGLLKGGGVYTEYKTSDTRLTIEIVKKAVEYGTLAVSYSEVISFIYQNQTISGVQMKDLVSGDIHEIHSNFVINSTGPWVDELRKKDRPLKGKRIHLAKGIHLTMCHKRFPLNHPVYFDMPDGRMIFAIPRYQKVYIGTTDTDFIVTEENDREQIAEPPVEMKDINYLLSGVNRMFPSVQLSVRDVESSWAGLRSLIHEEGKMPSELSRKDEIFVSENGLISIAGGKLTGYRLMAKKTVDRVVKKISVDKNTLFKPCQTKHIPLSGGHFPFKTEDMRSLIEFADQKYDEAKQTGISPDSFKTLFYRYGMNIDRIIEKAYQFREQEKDPRKVWIKAELWYAIHHEMTVTLSDFFIRRTEMLHFDRPAIVPMLEYVMEQMAEMLQWTDQIKETNRLEFMKKYMKAIDFPA